MVEPVIIPNPIYNRFMVDPCPTIGSVRFKKVSEGVCFFQLTAPEEFSSLSALGSGKTEVFIGCVISFML